MKKSAGSSIAESRRPTGIPRLLTSRLPIIVAALMAATGLTAINSARAATASVTVNAASSLGSISNVALGVNTAAWDGGLTNSDIPGLLQQAGVNIMRFPGGSTADLYHWQTNSATAGSGQYINPDDSFDNFMNVVNGMGGTAIIIANYGSNAAGTAGGDPNEAAQWVHYANVTKGYGIKYWEIGNEVYGNAEYGGNWEEDLHASQTPSTYGSNVVLFANAMKAQDPTIKIGAVLCAPGAWPDGVAPDWNSNVLAACGHSIDFVIVHWYAQAPGSESDSGLLSTTSQIAGMVSGLRSLINQYCGANAPNVQIAVTEMNSVYANPGKQTVSLVNALFCADAYMQWLTNGVTNIDWWNLHNGIDTGNNISASLYGNANYGDYGILAFGNCGGSICEPPMDTPFPSYYALQMLSRLGKPGDQMVSASSSQSLTPAYAVKQANGDLALLLINKDPNNSYTESISVSGYTPASTATSYFYGEGSSSIASGSVSGAGSSFTQTIPPYSLTTIVMTPGSQGTRPPAPTGLSAAAGSGQVSLSWNASSGATGYNVKRASVSGGPYTTIASPTSTSFTDTGLTNGTTYYYVVSAVNTAGESANSSQVSATPQSAVPAAPTGLQATAASGQVSLTWNSSTGATSYNVKRASVSGGPYTTIASPTGASFTDTGLTNGTAYYYVVSAVNGSGESANSAQVSATPTASSNPTFTAATSVSAASVNAGGAVTIKAVVTDTGGPLSNGIVDLEVYNSAGTQVGQQYLTGQNFSSGQAQTYTWNWTAPSAAGTYTVEVGVFDSTWATLYYWNSSAATLTVTTAAPPPTPTGLTATPGNGRVTLNWNAASGATSYHIKRATASAGPYTTVASPTGTSYINSGLKNGTMYYFMVSAVNAMGESPNSSPVNAKPAASTPPAFTDATMVSPATVNSGATVTITATVTDTGGSLSNGIMDLEVYDSNGNQVAQQDWSAQTFSAGQSHTYNWSWIAATPGTYRVRAAVYNSTWATLYYYDDTAATITVN